MLNDVLPPLEETVFLDKDECCFQQDFVPAHEVKNKNCCKSMSQISSKRMTDPPLAQTLIHWIINYGWCWRNVPAPRGSKISTHWSGEGNSSGYDSWINRWLAQSFVVLCVSKRRSSKVGNTLGAEACGTSNEAASACCDALVFTANFGMHEQPQFISCTVWPEPSAVGASTVQVRSAVSMPRLASTHSHFLFRGKSYRSVARHTEAASFGARPVLAQVYSRL